MYLVYCLVYLAGVLCVLVGVLGVLVGVLGVFCWRNFHWGGVNGVLVYIFFLMGLAHLVFWLLDVFCIWDGVYVT